jgi:hypothetical protein
MATCDVCGNDYDKAFQVTSAGRTMTFDSFECAIQAMAPVASIAAARSSATESRPAARCIAAPIAPSTRAASATASPRAETRSAFRRRTLARPAD